MDRTTKRQIIEVLLRRGRRRCANAVARLVVARMTLQEALDTLGVTADELADPAGLKRAYRNASMTHHPDRGGSKDAMQRVNEAYEVLRNLEGKVVLPSDRAAREQRYEQAAAIIKQMMTQAFDPKRFTQYLEKTVGKNFTFKIEWREKSRYGNYVGFQATWTSDDKDTIFYLSAHSNVVDFAWGPTKLGVGQDFSFDLSAYTEIFHETRKVKFRQNEWSLSNDSRVVFDPAKLFPAKKIKDMVGGKEKKRKFSRRDMVLGLEKRLNARVWRSGKQEIANVPFGKDDKFTIQFQRIVMMRQPTWEAHRLSVGKPGLRSTESHQLPTGVWALETEALLVTLIDLQKKSRNIDDVKSMLRLTKQAFDALQRQQRKDDV